MEGWTERYGSIAAAAVVVVVVVDDDDDVVVVDEDDVVVVVFLAVAWRIGIDRSRRIFMAQKYVCRLMLSLTRMLRR